MADISKCRNKDCKDKETCYRFNAKANPYRQAYSDFKPVDGVCKNYWSIESKSQLKRLDIQTRD